MCPLLGLCVGAGMLGAAGLRTDEEGHGRSTFNCQFAPATPLSTLTAGLGAVGHCPHVSDKEPESEMPGYLPAESRFGQTPLFRICGDTHVV